MGPCYALWLFEQILWGIGHVCSVCNAGCVCEGRLVTVMLTITIMIRSMHVCVRMRVCLCTGVDEESKRWRVLLFLLLDLFYSTPDAPIILNFKVGRRL